MSKRKFRSASEYVKKRATKIAKQGKIIDAIKYVHRYSDLSLKDSLYLVRALIERGGK